MPEKIKIQGNLLPAESPEIIPLVSDHNNIAATYRIDPIRSRADIVDLDADEDDILALEFDDGGEWIGHVSDIHEIFGEHIEIRSRGGNELFPMSLRPATGDRGLVDIGVKLINLIKGKVEKKITEAAARKIVEKADKYRVGTPGLFQVRENGSLVDTKLAEIPGKYLLFLHGTFSNFDGSFGDLFGGSQQDILTAFKSEYQTRMIALEHHTLGVSPFKNAIDLLNALPIGINLDIISHSRGGIIADILASCSGQSVVYPKELIQTTGRKDPELASFLEEINKLAKSKKIKVEKVIRIACPARGTLLLAERLDYFLNALLRAIGHHVGGKLNGVYQYIKGFITDVIKARMNADIMPGLLAMVPESLPQNILNRTDISLTSQLVVIEGNAELGKNLWHSLKVILTNLYYWEANDFVVNTSSMRAGPLRNTGVHVYLSEDGKTSHFNYFSNANTRQAIASAVTTPVGKPILDFEFVPYSQGERGVVADLFVKLKKISRTSIKGDKSIVIVIPGIMGTHLSYKQNTIWADLGEIGKGRMVTDLNSAITDIDHTEIIGNYYENLIVDLENSNYEVRTLGYDWRLSLSKAAGELNQLIKELSTKKQEIAIIAHSMGGLVVREMMRLHPTPWSRYIKQQGSKVVLLGTPWKGSHLIMQVFTGHHKKVRQINLLDTRHDKEELINVFNNYPGIYELLPINGEEFETEDFWNGINDGLKNDKIIVPPLRKHFAAYKTSIENFKPDLTNVFYIAGKDDETPDRWAIKSSLFGPKLKYYGTPEGDGAVTWDLGIPKDLKEGNLYFAYDTIHGELANDERLLPGIKEILEKGKTEKLDDKPPIIPLSNRSFVNRNDASELVHSKPLEDTPVSNNAEDIYYAITDLKPPHKKSPRAKKQKLIVSVVHGDLLAAQYPVAVGHFKQDGITNAEAAINNYFQGKLAERVRVMNYPGDIGDSLILFDPTNDPKGVLILGLGEINSLTPYHLRKSVEAGIINYAMHFRDNAQFINTSYGRAVNDTDGTGSSRYDTRISCLCIGTGYGGLSMEESMNAILTGITQANEYIRDISSLKCIEEVEFIELFEHIAQNAYYQLARLENSETRHLNFELIKNLEIRTGSRRKFQFATETMWWHEFTTRLEKKDKEKKIPYIQFTSASGIARVEQENIFTSQKVINALLEQMANEKVWHPEYSKTLFEILVPNAFKDIIRHQNNVLWKLDVNTAAYPWELFHDYNFDVLPTFVRAGLIRQLYTEESRQRPKTIYSDTALVIADPIYTTPGYFPLPFAAAEGYQVSKILKDHKIETATLVNKSGLEIINHLYNKEYRILHIAGHGIIDDDPNETGIVLDNDMFITPAMLDNFSKLPEFVFINCCYSGTIDPTKEALYQQRYKFAANIGTQLIRIGVSAVVVAGWPVNDAAAGLFAQVLYENLLDGATFGDAVKLARQACYHHSGSSNNTWGAYQCYGDQWYKLSTRKKQTGTEIKYFTLEQVLADLYNLESDTASKPGKQPDVKKLETELADIISRAQKVNLYTAPVIEQQARILGLINKLDEAIDRYGSLRQLEDANYTVKALEQFCNLRIKNLANNILASKKSNKTAITDKSIIEKTKAELNSLQHDFQNLLLIGETPERLSILGSAFKRMALIMYELDIPINEKKPLVQNLFKSAAASYLKAYELIPEEKLQKSIYSISNFLVLNSVSGVLTVSIKNKKINITALIEKVAGPLSVTRSRHADFWEDISSVNLMEAQLFYSDIKEIMPLCKKILKNYKAIWKVSGTKKHLETEIEQIAIFNKIVEVHTNTKWMEEMRKGLEYLVKGFEEMK